MTAYKEKFESLKELIPHRVENLSEAKEYVDNVYKKLERGVRKVGRGIGETAHFYRKNPKDVILTGAGLAGVASTAIPDGIVLSDSSVAYEVSKGFQYVPQGVTFIPPHIPHYSDIHGIEIEPMNLGHYLSLAAPFLILGLTIVVEHHRLNKWKKSKQICIIT